MTRVAVGVVAAGHPSVVDAAAETLRSGGNAFDAVLAAGFAAAVVEPMFTSLGGGGFLLAHTADGRDQIFDFFVDMPGRGLPEPKRAVHFEPVAVHFPSSDQIFNIGLGSVATPGNLRGFLHAHERLGTLPLREVIGPAETMARDGVVLNAHQAYVIDLLLPINTHSEMGRSLFAPEGRALRVGERLCNRSLAAFLEELPRDGGRDLYEGALAQRIERDMREGDGLLTRDDLRSYRVAERAPLELRYRGRRLLTNPAPSLGGELIARTLGGLERDGLEEERWGSAAHLCALASRMEQTERARTAGGTTHISVCDAHGNAASMSLSNGEGSGYFAPDTGIMLNNMLGEDDLHPTGFHTGPPGERVASMMSPTLVFEADEVRMILGSGGSKRIRTALVQVISNVLDFGRPLGDAIDAPRIHWDGAALQIEPGLPVEGLEALRACLPVNEWSEKNLYFGGVHGVAVGQGGWGDPRRGGAARSVTR